MNHKTYETPSGTIHYWVNVVDINGASLIFLPGLTADHRLFDKQIEYFEGKCNVFVWDAPGHAASWPFELNFNLMDKARWLYEILEIEQLKKPVIVGQSMGGYVGQTFAELYPGKMAAFISIDSAPLQRRYVTKAEIWMLKRMESTFMYYPWKSLVKAGTNGVSTTKYGRKLMYDMMMEYDGDQKRYARISSHGFKMLAEGYEKNLVYEIKCPALLICGTKDRTGACIRYSKAWHKHSGIPLEWIKGAGHNSNTDEPEIVNHLIENLISDVE